jgi:hypothetical protein
MGPEAEEKKIKGTMVIDVVKTIKKAKDMPWDEHLSDGAKRLLREQILPSQWYPYAPVIECIWAVYRLLGKSSPEAAKLWGKSNVKKLFETVYKNLATENDTVSALEKLDLISRRTFSRGFQSETIKLGDRHYLVRFLDRDPQSEVICYLVQGWIEAIIEMTGGENGKTQITQKHWSGSTNTEIEVRWE